MRVSVSIISICLVVALGIGGTPGPATAQAQERNVAYHMGLGTAAFILTIPYGVGKIIYALGGAVTGGLAWALTGGRRDIARAIIEPTLRGDYVIVPENLTMERPLTFSGRDPQQQGFY